MSFKRYEIPDNYWPHLINAPNFPDFPKYELSDLLDDATFYIMPSIYMGGITFHRCFILLHKNFIQFSETRQLRIIAHEGYHLVQQKDWGWIPFMWRYISEWIKCGFSYDKMKSIGIEKAAYDYEKLFASTIMSNKP